MVLLTVWLEQYSPIVAPVKSSVAVIANKYPTMIVGIR